MVLGEFLTGDLIRYREYLEYRGITDKLYSVSRLLTR